MLEKRFRLYLSDESTESYVTKREAFVLFLLSIGWKTKEIARELNLSSYTIQAHINTIKVKLNCNTLFQLGMIVSRDKDRLAELFPAWVKK